MIELAREVIRLTKELAKLRAVNGKLLTACKLAKDRFDKVGMDWLGKGPDPLEEAIEAAEECK